LTMSEKRMAVSLTVLELQR